MLYPEIGSEAPAFELHNHRGETVRLADYRGKNVVLYFYPKALTPGCTVQACGVRDTKNEIESLNAVVLGVSPDPVDKLQKFVDKHDLNFDLLADTDHAVAERYGTWGMKKFMGKEYLGIKRVTFIIDGSGVIGGVYDSFKTKSHHEELIGWLEACSER